MSNSKAVLTYFSKMANGSVPTDGAVIIRRAIDEDLMSKNNIAQYFGVQAKQVIKISGNLRDRDVRRFCSYIVEQNTPS